MFYEFPKFSNFSLRIFCTHQMFVCGVFCTAYGAFCTYESGFLYPLKGFFVPTFLCKNLVFRELQSLPVLPYLPIKPWYVLLILIHQSRTILSNKALCYAQNSFSSPPNRNLTDSRRTRQGSTQKNLHPTGSIFPRLHH